MLPQSLLEAGSPGQVYFTANKEELGNKRKPCQSPEVNSGWTCYFIENTPRGSLRLPRVHLRPGHREH